MRKESRAVLRTFSPILAEHVLELLAVGRQCRGSRFFNQKMPAVTSGGTCSMCGTIMKHLSPKNRNSAVSAKSRFICAAHCGQAYSYRTLQASSSLGCSLGFDQFRCTRPGQLVVGGRSPRPCRPTALLQVLALLPVGRDFSQGCQICLRFTVLQELLHADRREDCHDCGASLLSRMSVGGAAKHPAAPRKSYSH